MTKKIITMMKANRGKLKLYRQTGSSIIMGFAKFFKLKKNSDNDLKNKKKNLKSQRTPKQHATFSSRASYGPENITSIVPTKASPHLNVPRKES